MFRDHNHWLLWSINDRMLWLSNNWLLWRKTRPFVNNLYKSYIIGDMQFSFHFETVSSFGDTQVVLLIHFWFSLFLLIFFVLLLQIILFSSSHVFSVKYTQILHWYALNKKILWQWFLSICICSNWKFIENHRFQVIHV